MNISVFDLFKIGVGPSSSHTVGPMLAASMFARSLEADGLLDRVAAVTVELFGSLGATGHGHGSVPAVTLGLIGHQPDTVDPRQTPQVLAGIRESGRLALLGRRSVRFDPDRDIVLHRRKRLEFHSNALLFVAREASGEPLSRRTYYSIGGGFVLDGSGLDGSGLDGSGLDGSGADRSGRDGSAPDGPGLDGSGSNGGGPVLVPDPTEVPFPFRTGEELLQLAATHGMRISDVVRANERVRRTDEEITAGLLWIWAAMQDCVRCGIETSGVLPGGLQVRRRAQTLYQQLSGAAPSPDGPSAEGPSAHGPNSGDPLAAMDWVALWALAVNEENAAGGRVVTAPTNGAAGIIPAVLHFYQRFCPGADEDGIVRFLLVAGGIAGLIKQNASISGAEVGCQGEVGSACSMAAAGLAEVLGGTPEQVENAAEIGIEHNLGLTCDPVGGLVQIPCIERNAVAAVKAITAARIAIRGDGMHHVSLDKAIKTMRETGADMKDKYKETARGGLALNVVEC